MQREKAVAVDYKGTADSDYGETTFRAWTLQVEGHIPRAMRRILLRSVIGIACFGAVLIAWVAGARSLSLLLDRLHTVEIDSQPIARLGVEDANRGMLQVNDHPMSTAMPNYSPYPMEMKVDPDRQFVVQSANHGIALGRVDDSLAGVADSGSSRELATRLNSTSSAAC